MEFQHGASLAPDWRHLVHPLVHYPATSTSLRSQLEMRRDGVAEGEMKGDQGESGGEWGRVGESEAIDLASEVRLCPPITPCDLSCLPLLFIMFAVVAAVCCF